LRWPQPARHLFPAAPKKGAGGHYMPGATATFIDTLEGGVSAYLRKLVDDQTLLDAIAKLGDEVTIRTTEALAISVEKP
jgi:hypothetical protein